MNILLIGSGGREHALAWAMAASPLCDKLFVAPGNPGTGQIARNVEVNATDHAAVIAFWCASWIAWRFLFGDWVRFWAPLPL